MYPEGAADAIEMCELLTCWDMFRDYAEGVSIHDLREKMRGSAATAVSKLSGPEQELMKKALAQMDHPDFLLYLNAKLGAM